MAYQRSLEIADRLDAVLKLIRTGQFSTPMLAEKIGVSVPTISRIVAALRSRGYDIRADHEGNNWRYVLAAKPKIRRLSRNRDHLHSVEVHDEAKQPARGPVC